MLLGLSMLLVLQRSMFNFHVNVQIQIHIERDLSFLFTQSYSLKKIPFCI